MVLDVVMLGEDGLATRLPEALDGWSEDHIKMNLALRVMSRLGLVENGTWSRGNALDCLVFRPLSLTFFTLSSWASTNRLWKGS